MAIFLTGVSLSKFIGGFMKIDIDRFGLKNVEVDPQMLFSFPKGILGFESVTNFKVFHEEDRPTIFWLQSIDDPAVMFPIIAPEAINVEYEFELTDEDCTLIDLKDINDVAVAVIVYRDEADGGKIAANTKSPVVLNIKDKKGMQKVLHDVHPTLLYRVR